MIHTQVYGFFQTCLPDQAKKVKEYFPNGKNSIRILLEPKDGTALVRIPLRFTRRTTPTKL